MVYNDTDDHDLQPDSQEQHERQMSEYNPTSQEYLEGLLRKNQQFLKKTVKPIVTDLILGNYAASRLKLRTEMESKGETPLPWDNLIDIAHAVKVEFGGVRHAQKMINKAKAVFLKARVDKSDLDANAMINAQLEKSLIDYYQKAGRIFPSGEHIPF
jgi:hypothetical protein